MTPENFPLCAETAQNPVKTSCGHVPCYDCAQTWFETFYFCRSYEEALYNQPEGITVVVVENNSMHFELSFRIKRTAQLKKLMDIVCDEGGVSPQTARLLYRGAQIDFNDTAEELEMLYGDLSEVFHEQAGGL